MNNPIVQEMSAGGRAEETRPKERDIAIDYLRAFVVVLVVFLHAALAYTSFSTIDETHYVDSSAPIIDTHRWPFLDLWVIFLDTFFMALLFLVSGLFTLSSLERKGSQRFFAGRLQRLGVPFVVASVLIAPLTYWASYLAADIESQTPFLVRFFTSDGWQVGPPWFLWVLLVLNGIVVLAHRYTPSALAKLRQPPTGLVIFLVTVVSYLPLCLCVSPTRWMSLGPFDMQTSRIALYFAYFLLGIAVGTGQQWRQIGWPKRWGYWLVAAILSFVVYIISLDDETEIPHLIIQTVRSVSFAMCCTGASLGLLGAFRKYMHRSRPVWDSLSANAFGIYIIHYLLVIWIQYALLPAAWPAWIKFGVTFVGGLATSWGISASVRQISAVRRFI